MPTKPVPKGATPARPAATRPEPLLSGPHNSKLGALVWSWLIPAIATCPGATALCRRFCYATAGHFTMAGRGVRYERNRAASEAPDFVRRVVHEVRRGFVPLVRVHVAGDFYSAAYARKWAEVARACPQTVFFGYTRSWRSKRILPALLELAALPNVRLWWSEDAETGPSPPADGVRVAFMVVKDADEALVDPARHDLVFRDTRHRTVRRSPLPTKWIGGVCVCPAEQWYVFRHQMRGRWREPVKVTCSRCQICIRPDPTPRSPQCRAPPTPSSSTSAA